MTPADSLLLSSHLPFSASRGSSVESSDEFGRFPSSNPCASSPSVVSSGESSAFLSLSSESSDDLSSGSSSAFDISESWSGTDDASLSVSNESSDDSGSHVPADSSCSLTGFPDGTVVSSLSESSGNLGTLPVSEPLALGPLSLSSLGGCASLS